jgi:N-methylhydantoinase A
VALTDALLVLGYIDAARFLGGTMQLDRDAALQACAAQGATLGLDAAEVAWGVREIALAEMVKATRARLSIHALSASEHTLVSYGGCGALFAGEVARMAGLKRVIVPELASVLSAYGAATMDIRRERLSTLLLRLPGDGEAIDRAIAEMRDAVWQDLAADGVQEADRVVKFEADMRYIGQRWELAVALPDEPALGDGGREAEAIFKAEYLRRYGAAAKTTSGVAELVAIRAIGIGAISGSTDAATEPGPARPHAAHALGSRPVKLTRAGAVGEVATFDGVALTPGVTIQGPALVDASDTTIWIPGDMHAWMDAHRNLVIEAKP